MGALQGHSLLVESPDQIVWCRARCGHLDFTSGFDANPPTSKRIYGENRFLQRCSGSPWRYGLRLKASSIPLACVSASKRIWLSLVLVWTKACSWWMWFEPRSRGWLVPRQGQGRQCVCTRPDECTRCRCSSRRLPEGAATIWRQRRRRMEVGDSQQSRSKKWSNMKHQTESWGEGQNNQVKDKCKLLCQMSKSWW